MLISQRLVALFKQQTKNTQRLNSLDCIQIVLNHFHYQYLHTADAFVHFSDIFPNIDVITYNEMYCEYHDYITKYSGVTECDSDRLTFSHIAACPLPNMCPVYDATNDVYCNLPLVPHTGFCCVHNQAYSEYDIFAFKFPKLVTKVPEKPKQAIDESKKAPVPKKSEPAVDESKRAHVPKKPKLVKVPKTIATFEFKQLSIVITKIIDI